MQWQDKVCIVYAQVMCMDDFLLGNVPWFPVSTSLYPWVCAGQTGAAMSFKEQENTCVTVSVLAFEQLRTIPLPVSSAPPEQKFWAI